MRADLLIVCAHPDDETLLAGGTIMQRVCGGATVRVVAVAEGITSRDGHTPGDIERVVASFNAATRRLGVREATILGYPDNRLDIAPLLKIVKVVEAIVADARPAAVITHCLHDLNIDHRRVAEAVLVACRPLPGCPVGEVLAGESLSSTEWSLSPFAPSLFVRLSDNDARAKMEALACYNGETRPFPHARSVLACETQMRLRGASVGSPWAEAFEVLRILR